MTALLAATARGGTAWWVFFVGLALVLAVRNWLVSFRRWQAARQTPYGVLRESVIILMSIAMVSFAGFGLYVSLTG